MAKKEAETAKRATNPCLDYSECSDCHEDISCFRKIAGVLSNDEVDDLKLIPNKKEKNSNPTVYDLSLGSFHYVYGNPDSKGKPEEKWTAICIGPKSEFDEANKNEKEAFIRQNKNKTNILTIPAMGSALIQLNEIVDTYTPAVERNVLVTGRFDLKLTYVNQGLVSQQGTQVEPCYRGRLYCFVHNLSNTPIPIEYDKPIASIEFSYVSCFCNLEKRKEVINKLIEKNKKDERYLESNYCDEGKGILNVRYFNSRKYLPESCGLSHIREDAINAVQEPKVLGAISGEVSKKISDEINTKLQDKISGIVSEEIKKKSKDKKDIITIFAGIGGSIIIAVASAIGSYNSTRYEINDLRERINDCNQKIETYESKMSEYESQIDALTLNSKDADKSSEEDG